MQAAKLEQFLAPSTSIKRKLLRLRPQFGCQDRCNSMSFLSEFHLRVLTRKSGSTKAIVDTLCFNMKRVKKINTAS